MKKTTLLAILSFAPAASCLSQGFNLGVNLGYGVGAGSQVLGVNSTLISEENVVGSLGQGFNAGLDLNYMFNPNLGLDLGMGILAGKEFEFAEEDSISSRNITLKGKMFRIMPGIRVSAGDDKNLVPYSRFGLAIGLGTKVVLKENHSDEFSLGFSEYELRERVSVGWYGAFGIGFRVNDKIRMNTELLMINQSWAPGKLKNTVNSDGPLDSPVTLEDEVSGSSYYKDLTTRRPFGSVGLNLGVQYGF